jgi:uncharacterized protein
MRMRTSIVALAGALALISATPALAQAVSAELREAGVAGDQADGYMAVVPGAAISAEQKRTMDQVNIQRRADFTKKAAETGVTAAQFGQQAACQIFKNSVKPGNWYRDENNAWHKATGAVPLPSWCAS